MSSSPSLHLGPLIEAVKSFLDETDINSMEEFNRRLQPYKIVMREATIGGVVVPSPILLLEGNQYIQRDEEALQDEAVLPLATSLSSTDGLDSVNSFSRGFSPNTFEASELAGPFSLEDIGFTPRESQIHVAGDLAIDALNVAECSHGDVHLWDGQLALEVAPFDLPPDTPPLPRPIHSNSWPLNEAGLSAAIAGQETFDLMHAGYDGEQSPMQTYRGYEAESGLTDLRARSSLKQCKSSTSTRKGSSYQETPGPLAAQSLPMPIYIREDFVCFIEKNIPHWRVNGLWYRSALSDPNWGISGYESLQNIYSCMCELDIRINHDPIRRRAALVLLDAKYKEALADWQSQKSPKRCKESIGVGRGDASAMIDNILARMHSDWGTYNSRRRAELRSKFHNDKRYGKRWSILVGVLGPSILFLCSPQLVKLVRDSTVTATVLEQVASNWISESPHATGLLQVVNPMAHLLLYNGDYCSMDPGPVLERLHCWRSGSNGDKESRK
ncbi:hypothetical protein BO71DRAFT_481292 [Aspergillus ellipticus CBS 707.79]|uniref:Uncharacterized protein n=1 Tax=Aspergillus ellipticus CBS 707.79 TaxID=1448320 RepID=A0A319DIU9_9EURO|nr:hypothetical protein BO71DRAFT_481292 [Aspergillus ellipticus CBS 707.79]